MAQKSKNTKSKNTISVGGNVNLRPYSPAPVIGGSINVSATGTPAPVPSGVQGQSSIDDFARQLFNIVAPGEDWNRNRNSFLALVARLKRGEMTGNPIVDNAYRQITGSPVSPTGIAINIDSTTGKKKFNTGDPELDKFLNETYLPLLEAEFAEDPSALENTPLFKNISERIGKQYGPVFDTAKRRVEEDYALKTGDVDLRRRQQIAEISQNLEARGIERTRAIEDATNIVNRTQREFELTESDIDLRRREQLAEIESKTGELGTERTRVQEDIGVQRTRIARNMQNAVQESAAAFASAGRAFGGGRAEAERKIQESGAENLADMEKQAKRSLENIQKQEQQLQSQRQFGEERFGLAGREAQERLQTEQQRAEREQQRSLQDVAQREAALRSQQGFIGEQAGLGEREALLGKGRNLDEIEAERQIKEVAERRRLRELGATIIENPESFVPSGFPYRTLT